MINEKKLERVLQGYKKHFPQHWEKEEKYKWQAVQWFQDHWDDQAEDFAAMLENALAKTGNLLAANSFFPRRMILEFAQKDPAAVWRMFVDLYDESKDLAGRVDRFRAEAERLLGALDYKPEDQHFQTTNAISTYLWLMYPDKYYIYKYSIFQDVLEELESDHVIKANGSAESMIEGFKMYDEICAYIQKDKNIKALLKTNRTGDCWPDDQCHTLTVDVGFYLSRWYLPVIWKISHGTNKTGASDEEKLIFEKRQVIAMDSQTKALAGSKETQGQYFMEHMKKGDFFYLCYGNQVKLLGQITSDTPVENPEKRNGWFERSYRLIKKSENSEPYTGEKKWWTPNYNSTCVEIGDKDEKLFEKLILKPYFDMTVDELYQYDPSKEKYAQSDFLRDVYMSEADLRELQELLKEKKNVILQGPPGVGKTFAAKRLAYLMMGEVDKSRVEMVQFHQNYSYEDFVEGYRPVDDGFKLKDGIFSLFCRKARENPDKSHFFIIDELNRGEISRIFGELLMLIENNYRGEEIPLPYSGQPFSVPDNLYIIGLMNTADRSLALIDYALRRRFSFFDMTPGFDTEGFKAYQHEAVGKVSDEEFQKHPFTRLISTIRELNEAITKDDSLGDGFCIGHSYFCGREEKGATIEWMRAVVKYDILPTLKEYWFDDDAKYTEWSRRLKNIVERPND